MTLRLKIQTSANNDDFGAVDGGARMFEPRFEQIWARTPFQFLQVEKMNLIAVWLYKNKKIKVSIVGS